MPLTVRSAVGVLVDVAVWIVPFALYGLGIILRLSDESGTNISYAGLAMLLVLAAACSIVAGLTCVLISYPQEADFALGGVLVALGFLGGYLTLFRATPIWHYLLLLVVTFFAVRAGGILAMRARASLEI